MKALPGGPGPGATALGGVALGAGYLASNLAGLANAAISSIRFKGRFLHIPQASRHYAARQGDALREITRLG